MPSPLYRTATIRRIETAAFATVPVGELMRRAGDAVARHADELLATVSSRVTVLCGPGNNGGDGFIAAAALHELGHRVSVVVAPEAGERPADAARALAALPEGVTRITDPASGAPPALVIDALFGIGLTRPIVAPFDRWIAWANAQRALRLAIDIPSGLDADTGRTRGPAFHATDTVTFLGDKPGLHTAEGPGLCGAVVVDALGIDPSALGVAPDGQTIDATVRSLLPARSGDSHKGTHGSALIIGGASGMTGAPILSARAALKTGAGRVFVGLLDMKTGPGFDPVQPELMLRSAHDALAAGPTAVAIGPGLGTSDAALELLREVVALTLPLVLDADAINLVALNAALGGAVAIRTEPTILTPHPLEAARLLKCDAATVQGDRVAAACALAKAFNASVVLKGRGTVVASPDLRWFICESGGPALASAGTGDVLTGMLAALLAQGLAPIDAARLGVWLHGAAADALVARGVGPIGLTAGELADAARALLNARQE